MKTRTQKITTAVSLAMTVLFFLSSCKKDEDNAKLTASLTIVNSVEGSAAQDVYINDAKTSSSAVAYASASSNISTSTGTKTIVFKNTGSSTVTASATINADANSSQSIFLVKRADGSYGVNTYAKDNATVSGKAKVRFVNVAPLLSGAVNVTTSTGAAIISGLAFQAASAYQTVDANTALNVSMTGSLEVTTISATELEAGKNYIVWFDSSTTTKVKYHVVLQN
ncbi:DUF4397 domain-containing protein [Pedobacter sp. PWIIR3]